MWRMAACLALRYVPRKPVLQHFLWWESWDWDWAHKQAGQHQDGGRPRFASTKNTTDGEICLAFEQSQHEWADGGENMFIWVALLSSATLLVPQLSHSIANFSNFTASEKSRVLLLGTSGTCGNVKTSSSLALQLSSMKYIWSTVMTDPGEWVDMQEPSVPSWQLGSNCSAGRQKASAISWGSHAKSVGPEMTCFPTCRCLCHLCHQALTLTSAG